MAVGFEGTRTWLHATKKVKTGDAGSAAVKSAAAASILNAREARFAEVGVRVADK